MTRLVAAHGDLPLSALDGPAVDSVTVTWSGCAPATWNRHVATLRSFTAFARRKGWLAEDPATGLERRTEPADRTKAIAASSLARLFRREDVAIREKCLWRLLYETAARAEEVLSADVGDLDLENKRLRVVRKGGDRDWLHFQSGSARLLPMLIEGRDAGPLFLADRRPAPANLRRGGPHNEPGRLPGDIPDELATQHTSSDMWGMEGLLWSPRSWAVVAYGPATTMGSATHFRHSRSSIAHASNHSGRHGCRIPMYRPASR